jgi:hypothetical protein
MMLGFRVQSSYGKSITRCARGSRDEDAETVIVAGVVVEPGGLVVKSQLQKNRSVALT